MLNTAIARARRVRQDRESGFTLIELLIVIVILGILASIVVFSVKGIQDKGKTSACKSDVAAVTTAAEAYYAQENKYPAAIADLTTDAPTAAHPQLQLLHSAPTNASFTFDSTGAAAPTAGAC